MMMLKYRSHQSSSNLVLLWRAHSQQNDDKRAKNGTKKIPKTTTPYMQAEARNEQKHATLICENN